jgi:microsomal epoxide hydrolase
MVYFGMNSIPIFPPSSFHHHFSEIDGLRLHYVQAGKGALVVLLSGFPQSWYAWRKVMPALAEYYTVIAVDLPGQGDSDKPTTGYDTQSLARSVHRLVTKLGHERFFLAAHDVGAWVSLPLCMAYPESVRRLVILDAFVPGVTLPEAIPVSPSNWKSWHLAFHAIPDLPETLITGREREYITWFLRRKAADPSVFTDEDISEYLRIFTASGALRAGLAYYRAVFESIVQNKAFTKKLEMPVLAFGGEQGSAPKMAESMKVVANNVRGSAIPNCGHYIPEEAPEFLAKEMLAFFAEEK